MVETFSKGKFIESGYSEDCIVDGRDFVGVLDGAGGPSVPTSEFVQRMIQVASTIIVETDGGLDAVELANALTRAIRELKKDVPIKELKNSGGLFFALLNRKRSVIWRIGDCTIRVANDVYQTTLPVEKILADMRSVINEASLLEGAELGQLLSDDPARNIVGAYLTYQRAFSNRAEHPLGYGVVNGEPIPTQFIEEFAILGAATEVVLATDGYPYVLGTLRETETALFDLLRDDPGLFQRFKAAKGRYSGQESFDDRSYVRVISRT
ncbi:MAG: hypothetical protein ABL957_16625 [Parvularculaceae bacterium]